MIALLALMAAVPAGDTADARYAACTAQVEAGPEAGLAMAEAWRDAGGGVPARQCLGLAFVALERWAPAALAFEQAAKSAQLRGEARAAALWVQAANASLAGGDAARSRAQLDRALALPSSEPMKGEAWLDRARAGVAAGDTAGARADLDRALKLVPEDPLAWLLSAGLARRMKDQGRAEHDVTEALRLAPDDADVALEAGRVAAAGGAAEAARAAFARAAALDPKGAAGEAARAALAAL